MDLRRRIGDSPQTLPSELAIPVNVREVSEQWLGDVLVRLRGLPPLLSSKIRVLMKSLAEAIGDSVGDWTTLRSEPETPRKFLLCISRPRAGKKLGSRHRPREEFPERHRRDVRNGMSDGVGVAVPR
jgi:hypothetical protein